ncbi:hypothetical protein EC951288_3483B, partial [Escherichia coli 95.1288]
TSWFHINF